MQIFKNWYVVKKLINVKGTWICNSTKQYFILKKKQFCFFGVHTSKLTSWSQNRNRTINFCLQTKTLLIPTNQIYECQERKKSANGATFPLLSNSVILILQIFNCRVRLKFFWGLFFHLPLRDKEYVMLEEFGPNRPRLMKGIWGTWMEIILFLL